MRKLSALVLIPLACVAGCGGGGGSTPPPPPSPPPTTATAGPPNVESMTIDGGPSALTVPAVNTAFISVKICAPGNPANCQTIDHVEVDTGSVGLRLIAGGSVGPGSGELTMTLPAVTDTSGSPLAECFQFADGFSWGSVVKADITLPVSGETAANANVHVIGASSVGDPSQATPTCVPLPGSALMAENTVTSFGANGILGLGPFVADCAPGESCTPGTPQCAPGGTPCIPQYSSTYYSCPTPTTCAQTTASASAQLQNPASLFAKDNNGVIIELPAVPSGGAANPSGGLLVFGIGTESNNGLGSASQLMADPASGYITAMLNGSSLADSYLDSGSNANFFSSSMTVCLAPNNGFYCPTATTAENAAMGSNSVASDFDVANACSQFGLSADCSSGTANSLTAFNNLGGPNPDPQSLDLGLPFFFGRHVYTGFANPSTGAAPFFAY